MSIRITHVDPEDTIRKLKAKVDRLEKALAEQPAPEDPSVAEPIYQCQDSKGKWTDQEKHSYDYNVKHGSATVRVVYITPQPAQQEPVAWRPTEADYKEWCERHDMQEKTTRDAFDDAASLYLTSAPQPAQQEPWPENPAAPVQQEACPTCGEYEPRTGTCGTSPNDKRALCNRNAPQPAQQEPVDSMGMPLSCGKPLCSPGDHHPLCKLAEQPAQQEPCGWQFYQDGKWHNGVETNDHRKHTEAAGFPVRDVYPSPQPTQPSKPLTDEAQVLRSLLGASLGALRYHTEQTRPIQRTVETIAAIERGLATHGIKGDAA